MQRHNYNAVHINTYTNAHTYMVFTLVRPTVESTHTSKLITGVCTLLPLSPRIMLASIVVNDELRKGVPLAIIRCPSLCISTTPLLQPALLTKSVDVVGPELV